MSICPEQINLTMNSRLLTGLAAEILMYLPRAVGVELVESFVDVAAQHRGDPALEMTAG